MRCVQLEVSSRLHCGSCLPRKHALMNLAPVRAQAINKHTQTDSFTACACGPGVLPGPTAKRFTPPAISPVALNTTLKPRPTALWPTRTSSSPTPTTRRVSVSCQPCSGHSLDARLAVTQPPFVGICGCSIMTSLCVDSLSRGQELARGLGCCRRLHQLRRWQGLYRWRNLYHVRRGQVRRRCRCLVL